MVPLILGNPHIAPIDPYVTQVIGVPGKLLSMKQESTGQEAQDFLTAWHVGLRDLEFSFRFRIQFKDGRRVFWV